MTQHVVIPSDYPDEPNLHIMRHDDGDIAVAVAHGDRWPGVASTLCASGSRRPKVWRKLADILGLPE